MYGPTLQLAQHLERFGVEHTLVRSPGQDWEQHLRPTTRLIHLESPGTYTATFFVFAAFFFASALEASKVLRSLLEPVVSRLRSVGGVVVTTLVSGFAIVSATSNALITYFLVRDLFGGAFARRLLHPVNLSRSMEDSATLTEVRYTTTSGSGM